MIGSGSEGCHVVGLGRLQAAPTIFPCARPLSELAASVLTRTAGITMVPSAARCLRGRTKNPYATLARVWASASVATKRAP